MYLELLILRWSTSPTLRPLGLFDLTCSTYLSFNGLLLTYTIVLLQFKYGEGGGVCAHNGTREEI